MTETKNKQDRQMPLSVARAQFQQKAVELANTSGLPAFVMADVLRELLKALEQLAEQQYQQELAAYQAEDEKPAEKEA